MTGDLTRPPAWAGTEAPNPGLSSYRREIFLFLQGLLLLATSAMALVVCAWAWTLTAWPFVWFDGVLSPDGEHCGQAALIALVPAYRQVCRVG